MRVRVALCLAWVGAAAGRAEAGELAACAQDVTPGATAPTALAELPAEKARDAGVRARFALISPAARAAEEAAIAAWAPAWQLAAHVDRTGMATQLALVLPGHHDADELLPDALAFVRAHPCLFGAADPRALQAHAYLGRAVFVTAATGGPGAVELDLATAPGATVVTVTGHLWPIAAAEVPAAPARVLARYLGRAIEQDWEDLSTRTGTFGNHRTLRHAATELDFTWEAGRALICRDGALTVHAAGYVALNGKPDARAARPDPHLAELPTVVSLDDDRPFGPAWIMPSRRDPTDNDVGGDRASAAGAACLDAAPP